ncbi:TPR domain-containing protein [Pseudovirgaria hyperparasitica]|uniref:TPR domain-containing protein n=1 Tax=Pseudovirgaria hyperparasitica TaxID=470096 RepID=A0A6A6WIF1_9PEZI|nr:TPR domain-containing protein [Pseudovirgaria hyperparasitica]KAF2762029.1 TPR domain-containing protein [Pseudovirgaria hyperparasitica]
MAPTKPQDRNRRSKKSKNPANQNGAPKKPKQRPEDLLAEAIALLQTSQPDEALIQARRALAILQPQPEEPRLEALPALNLLGEICVELGDADTAREYFTIAAELDPEGSIPEESGGGSEKYLWLAQLCEEGGAESVRYFEQGATILRRQIAHLESLLKRTPLQEALLGDKKIKMANALCGVVEVYMTDLSWEEDAEARCESVVTEAMLVAPNSPEVLQTLANVRISQSKMEDAQSALLRSLDIWKDLPPEDAKVPDFPTRISLARLLMEADMKEEGFEVLDRLTTEDDCSVEAWYLGGWCLYLLGEEAKSTASSSTDKSDVSALLTQSRRWLKRALKLYEALHYEDDRLRDHTVELVEELDKTLGLANDEDDEDDEWVDEPEVDSEDETMEGT